MTSRPYNGHPSWNAWNVSLWISNDECLYNEAVRLIEKANTLKRSYHWAARVFINNLGLVRTPDGAKYSVNSVKLAFQGLV